MTKGQKILITGGVRSGKSRFALSLAKKSAQPKIFLATAQAFDDEIEKRIERHQEERDKSFSTLEEPLYLGTAVANAPPGSLIVIDCLTLWLNNLFFHFKEDEALIMGQIDLFLESVKDTSSTVIMITNETGWGIIPANPLSRRFIERAGLLNQRLASMSDEVILIVSGLAHWLKGKTHV